MHLKCLFFAGAKDLTGVRELSLEVEDGCTSLMLQDKLLERFPSLAQIWETCVFAVNQEYVDQEGEPPVLKEGDEVAIIPPISEDRLHLQSICDEVGDPGAGAISTFIGVTRNKFNGKEVLRLEYEAYKPMAESELKKICIQVREKWKVMHIAMYHKTGLVPIGEASVIIAISSEHRTEGLEAVHWAIDELKATVPIWKKEFYADGSIWKGNAECRHGHRAKTQPGEGNKHHHSHHHEHLHHNTTEHEDSEGH